MAAPPPTSLPAPGPRTLPARAVILATIVVNMLGVGLAWPILPKLVQEIEGGSVSQAAATYAGLATVFALAQFAFSPLMGALSDRFGRRPVMLVCLAGLAVDYAIMAVAPTIAWLMAARLVAGMFGAVIATANAAMADLSSPEDRARNFGLLGAAFGVGFIIGPLMGGLLGEQDLRLPFIAAGVLAAMNFLAALVFLPETARARGPDATSQTTSLNPLSALARIARVRSIRPLIVALFLTAIAQRGLEAIWVLYVDYRFGWGVRDAALSLVFVGVMSVIVQGGLVGPAVRRFGEWPVVIGGFAISAVALFLYALADAGWMVFPLIGLNVLGNALAGPSLNALCSRSAPPEEQGRLQGALNSVNALATIIGPASASLLLAAVTRQTPLLPVPGLWFLLSSAGFLLAVVLLLLSRRGVAPATPGRALG